jgi:lysophospholipase L1-like esterase
VRQRLWRAYQASILISAHGVLLFALLNGVAAVVLELRPSDPISLTYGEAAEALPLVYPGRSRDDIRELLRETWERTPAFEPFLVSRERKFRGRFVNVDPQGFRVVKNQVPWPPAADRLDVFVFGGSTTFGYGVADDETLVSALQERLARKIPGTACYNLGSAGYYSTQERILFEELLAQGHAPDVAVFVDGINEFAFSQPWLSPALRKFLAKPVAQAASTLVEYMPLTRLVARWKAHRDPASEDRVASYADPGRLAGSIERYLANRRLLQTAAAANGVKVLFVWQPTPLYEYDLSAHPFGDFEFGFNNYSRFGYPLLAKKLREAPLGPDFLWAAEIQKGLREALYVDHVHYTAAMNARLADTIAAALEERGYLTSAPPAKPVH